MSWKVTSVVDAGDDVLVVRGIDTAETQPADWDHANVWTPTVREARGWVSATTNPKAMAAGQVGAYALSLLAEQHPAVVTAVDKPIAFV